MNHSKIYFLLTNFSSWSSSMCLLLWYWLRIYSDVYFIEINCFFHRPKLFRNWKNWLASTSLKWSGLTGIGRHMTRTGQPRSSWPGFIMRGWFFSTWSMNFVCWVSRLLIMTWFLINYIMYVCMYAFPYFKFDHLVIILCIYNIAALWRIL